MTLEQEFPSLRYPNPLTAPVWPKRVWRGAFSYFREGPHFFESCLGLWTSLARIDGERVEWVQHVPSTHRARSGATGRSD